MLRKFLIVLPYLEGNRWLPRGAASELDVLMLGVPFHYPGEMSRLDWSDVRSDLIVADYFAMLADDISGRP